MRIIAGLWRGRTLAAPPGLATRPTAERMRQALFDMIAHAPWAEAGLAGARVLDGFAGTGALGLEALSRGAARAVFMERDRVALSVLRANIAACKAEDQAQVVACDVLKPPAGAACGWVFLDPPYAQDFVPRALVALGGAGWIAPGAVIVAETGRDEAFDPGLEKLAERTHGAALVTIWRWG